MRVLVAASDPAAVSSNYKTRSPGALLFSCGVAHAPFGRPGTTEGSHLPSNGNEPIFCHYSHRHARALAETETERASP